MNDDERRRMSIDVDGVSGAGIRIQPASAATIHGRGWCGARRFSLRA